MAKGKAMQAVINLAGSIDPSLGKAIEQAQNKISGLNIKALAVGAAVGGVAVATGKAVAKAGEYLKDLGGQFDEAADTIRIGTGATGDALDGLLGDFDEVYKSVPTTMGDASKAIADYNTRLGLTGPILQDISKQAIQVSDLLGEDLGGVIEESSQAFQQWNIDAADMGGAMDYIFKTSQSTGMGFTALMGNMQKFGPQLQEMGYSFEAASAMMGQLDKAGVNVDEVLGAMKKSVVSLAKEGIGASDGLTLYYEKIKSAGSAAEAASIASEIFGTRAGSTMAAAIRDGTLAVGDLTAELMASGETISGAADDTYDFTERLQTMKQGLEVALKPMANTVFDGLNKFMPTLQKIMEKTVPVIGEAVEAAAPFVEEFLVGAADTLEDVLPLISDLGADLIPALTLLTRTLLPPLLSSTQTLLPPLMQIVSAILPPAASLLVTILPVITQIASAVLPTLVGVISSLLPAIAPLLDIALQIVNTVILPLLPPLLQIVEAVLPPLVSLLNVILPLLRPLLSLLQPIASVLSTIVGWVSKIIGFGSGVIDKIAGLFGGGGGSGDVSGFAAGGFTRGISIAGEDPRYPTEAVISFNPAYRSENLAYWAEAGEMLGAPGADIIGRIDTLTGGGVTAYAAGGFTNAPDIKIDIPNSIESLRYTTLSNTEPLSYPAISARAIAAADDDPDGSYDLLSGGHDVFITYDLTGLTFSPQIKVESDVDENELIRKLRELEPEFIDFILEALARREDGAYVTTDSRLY